MRLTAFLLALLPLPAAAQDWFDHSSGELRSYHLDWLAACADGGDGACRVVYAAPDIGSEAPFDRRLTLRYDEQAGLWTPEVMDRGMVPGALDEIAFAFDEDTPIPVPLDVIASAADAPAPIFGPAVEGLAAESTGVEGPAAGISAEDVPSGDWPIQSPPGTDAAAQTVIVANPAYRDILLAEMRAGRRLLVTYAPAGEGDGEADLSLVGLTAAMAAVEAHVAERDDDA